MSKLTLEIPKEKENEFLELEVTYQLGGRKRGIYLHFTNVTIKKENGYTSRTFQLYGDGNCRFFVKELTRKSQKQLDLFFKYLQITQKEFIHAHSDENNEEIFELIKTYNQHN